MDLTDEINRLYKKMEAIADKDSMIYKTYKEAADKMETMLRAETRPFAVHRDPNEQICESCQ